ncbi:hypothetical protein JHD48_01105 [Sulfurimonas sp. SAG-AH-194-I05]|nr:hypothetical protein [Sulfurimonas sp. SAG-AH-194-I05]MDF1874326.1 hypothetical protein [Sulfurimonas sp. SAG-AH-194-I05]
MKSIIILLLAIGSLSALSIEQLSKNIHKMEKARETQREILSMDVDMREYRRSFIEKRRDAKSPVISKMIQLRDKNRESVN